MKKFYFITWIVFLLGFAFKFLHYPGGGVLLTLGATFILVHGIIYTIKFVKRDLPLTLLYISVALMAVYLFGRVQYWQFAKPLFPFSLLFTLACIVIYLTRNLKFGISQLFLVVYFVFFIIISFTPSYKIYYFVNLNTVLNNESRNTDYLSWDKYSWFLYLQNKQEEAIEANANSKNAVTAYLKISPEKEAEQFAILIVQHEQQIRDGNWATYP